MQLENFVNLEIDLPKGILLYGLPGTGKIHCAQVVANHLVQKCVWEDAHMAHELFKKRHTLSYSM